MVPNKIACEKCFSNELFRDLCPTKVDLHLKEWVDLHITIKGAFSFNSCL